MRSSTKAETNIANREAPTTKGTRTSARQKEKHQKILLIEKEKELARQEAGKLLTSIL
jgi:hypothetical protein